MSSMVPRIGDVIADKYRIERRLGGGGMGTVFSATHLMTGRRFAIKWMNTRSVHDTAARERFIREFQAAGSIDHPNVVAVLDVGSHDGTLYIVMEYLEGESLGKKISRGPMPPSDCVPIVVEAMRGVAAAHRLDIVHRDLKPDNIFVCAHDRAGLTVKVLDFGVMKPVNERAQSLPTITARGMAVGTPPYMAPEQVLALPSLDHRVDIYSFGVILFEALSGRLPYADVTGLLLLERIVRGGPPQLSQFVSGVPIGLEATVMRALSRDPRRRFQKLADFAACLRPWAAGAGAFGTVAPAVRRQVSGADVDAPRALPSETRTSTPDAIAALAKGRESYPRHDTPDAGVRAVTPAASREAPGSVAVGPSATEVDDDRPSLVDVAPPDAQLAVTAPVAAPAPESVTAKPAAETNSGDRGSRRGRKRKKRRRREREEAKAAAAAKAAENVEAASAETPESAENGAATATAAGESASTSTPAGQAEADVSANDTPLPAAEARARKDSVPEARVELPIEVALRRALAREGRLPLRHAWNTPDVDAVATPANDTAENVFAELARNSIPGSTAVAHSDPLSSRVEPAAADDSDPRRSRVPTLPLKLQDIEALRAAFQVRRDDSETSRETAITTEVAAPRSSRVSMHELSPWPALGPGPDEDVRDSWSAPTEMAMPVPRMPAMRHRGGWGLVGIAAILVCGIAWTQWDSEEDLTETEHSVSAASDIFASDPDDPFAELAPSLVDPLPNYDLARSRTGSNYEYPSEVDVPGAPPTAADGLADFGVAKAVAADAVPAPAPAPQGFESESVQPESDAFAREPTPATGEIARSSGAQPRTNPSPARSESRAVEHDVASAPAPASVELATASVTPSSTSAGDAHGEQPAAAPATTLPAAGTVVVEPAIAAMGPTEPSSAEVAANQTGARGTPATSTPATAGVPTPPTSASATPTAASSGARPAAAMAATASSAAPAPFSQPVDGQPALAQRDVVLLAPARAPDGEVEASPTVTAIAPPSAAPSPPPPFEYVVAGPSALATSPQAPATEAAKPVAASQPAQSEPPATQAANAPKAAADHAQPAQQDKLAGQPQPVAQPTSAEAKPAPQPRPARVQPAAQAQPAAQVKPASPTQPAQPPAAQLKPNAQPKPAAPPQAGVQKPNAQAKPAAQPQPAAQTKPNAPAKAGVQPQPAARPKANPQAAPAAQTKPNAPARPAAQTKPSPQATTAQPKLAAQPKPAAAPSAAAKPAATVTITKLDVASPGAAKPNAATVDVPASAARSGENKSPPPPPRKTSGVSVTDF